MHNFLSKLFPENIPKRYQKGFSQSAIQQNLRNLVLFSWFMLGIHVWFLITDLFHYISGSWNNNPDYYKVILGFHVITYPIYGSVLLIAKFFQKQIEALPLRVSENFVVIYIMITTSWLVGVAAYDQILHEKIPLYIFSTIVPGVLFTLSKKRVLFILLFGYGFLVGGLYLLQPNTEKMIGLLISGAGFAIIGYFAGLYYYHKRGLSYIGEQLLKERTKELKDKTRELEEVNGELQEVNGELKQFVYAVSHDLKAPLRMVSSFTHLLERSLNGSLKPESKEYMGFINNGAKRMNLLLDDLRNYAMVTKGDVEAQIVDLNLVVHQVRQNLHVSIEESNANIEVNPLPSVKAASTHLLQLFQNLISNAIKFRRNVPLKIVIQSEERIDDYLISISDNGIGIEKEYLGQVFTLFKRLHTEAEYEGTGIGLAICQKIINNYGGEIWLDSRPQIGTTFYFTLPKEH